MQDPRIHALLGLFAVSSLALPAAAAQEPGPEIPPGREWIRDVRFEGRAFVYEVDFALGRAMGWMGPQDDEDSVQREIADSLALRMVSTGRFVEASVAAEEGARISVTFVGKQADSIEAFLRQAIASPGHFTYGILATDADLAQLGVDLAEERSRFDAWREAHPDQPVAVFRTVPRDAGGAHPALRWVRVRPTGGQPESLRPAESGAEEDPTARSPGALGAPGAPRAISVRPLLSASSFRVLREDLESLGMSRGEEGSLGVAFDFADEPQRRFEAFLEAHRGRSLVSVIDGEIVELRELPPAGGDEPAWGELAFDRMVGDYMLDELRPLVFSLAGQPFRAPLRFVEFSKRPLKNVALEGE